MRTEKLCNIAIMYAELNNDEIIYKRYEKIVYTSYNSLFPLRNIKMFVEGVKRFVKIRLVEMFPNTYHIENAALLTKI
jgi:23S rRNA (uracil1939-C5)-methyltransferase